MQVFRCDRCGNHYTQREKRHAIDIFEIVDGEQKTSPFLSIGPHASDVLDLCPDCMISLIDWINSGGATDGRKFGYKYAEDINFNKIRKEIKEIKEDDNN